MMGKELIKFIIRQFGYDVRKLPNGSISFMNPLEAQRTLLKGVNQPIIFDVGAHHGDMAARYRSLFPESTIYCFEPFDESFELLARRFAHDSRIKTVRRAVSDKTAAREFFVSHRDATNSLLPRPLISRRYYPKGAGQKTTIKVQTTSLDDFLQKERVESIDILKLDIQGGELMALRGAEQTLKNNNVSLIFIEIMFVPHYEGGPLFCKLWDFPKDYKYSLFDIYDLYRARNGQLRYGDALFVSERLRSNMIDRFHEEP